ncbi:GNAT family N-acetyltransferase [Halosimplex pelagicum]|uniref:GNAT family N-acetyltransferase n=1 Tax=Halosimplex pelagicum TaxID=869886 RepID=A0A7D5PBM0_9EURY|nr:GNAT family N-acetyltransferase [Halosimplex pelagicum]QLH82362.1 GNAT family N-acetyltransferase [Halosimplex pelagicum]
MAKSEEHSTKDPGEAGSGPQWSVRPADSDDLHTARFLGRHYFGGDRDDSHHYIYRSTTQANQPHGHAVVAEANGILVGMAALHLKIPGAMHRLLDVPELLPYEVRGCLDCPVEGFNGAATGLGWIQLVAVDKAWWGNGIATQLLQELIEWANTSDIKTLAGISWQRDGKPDSTGLFKHHGFDCIAEYESFYAENDNRTFCPDCGEECECAGHVYVRDLQRTTHQS